VQYILVNEMTKIKIQTSPSGTFPTTFGAALAEMSKTKAETQYPFASSFLSVLLTTFLLQIPYTMAKFFYTRVSTEPKESYAKTTQLGITFASGYLAGVVCATVSHPADSVVSLMGKPANEGKSIGVIALETGSAALATKGLGTHVLMIGTLTGICTLYSVQNS
jgi:solute carrier family 25 phosphate transporter 3